MWHFRDFFYPFILFYVLSKIMEISSSDREIYVYIWIFISILIKIISSYNFDIWQNFGINFLWKPNKKTIESQLITTIILRFSAVFIK